MSNDISREVLLDELEIKRLGHLYARGADSNDPDMYAGVFTEDGKVDSPGVPTIVGQEALRKIPGMLRQFYHMTQHVVFNAVVHITGDTASGETYCQASHVTRKNDGSMEAFIWAIRYQDEYRKEKGKWRFSHRKLIVDWTETRPVFELSR